MAKIDIELPNGQKAGETLKQLTNQAAALRKELGGLKPGTDDFVKSAASLNQVDAKLNGIKSQIKDTTVASNGLKSAFGGILNQIPGFSQLSGALNSAKGGVGGLTSGFGLLKGAIIATGVGALVIVVTSLVQWFSKTEKGANMIAGAFKAMGAVVDTLMGKLWNIGDTLKQLFSNPIEFFKNLGKDIADAATEGYNFVQVMDDIEDRQRDMEVTAKQNDILVDQLLLQAKNVGKTFEQKISLLNQANEITRKTYKEQLALSKEYLDAVEAEVASELKRQNQTEKTDEQADRIKNAKLAYLDLLGQEIQTEEKIANRREQIIGKQEKANAKEVKDKEETVDKKIVADDKEAEHILANQAKLDEADKKAKAEQEKRDLEAAEKAKKTAEDVAKFESDLSQYKLQTAVMVAHGLGDLLVQNIEDEKKAKALKKKMALADIALNLVLELSQNAKWAAANPLNAVTLGLAGISQGAAMNIRSIAMAAIATAKVVGFRRGGDTGDGSINDVAGVVHRKEYVVPAWMNTNPKLSGVMGMLEGIRNNGFQVGGPVNPFDRSRGPVSSGASSSTAASSSALIDYNLLGKVIANEMKDSIARIRVENNLREVMGGLKALQKLSDDANV